MRRSDREGSDRAIGGLGVCRCWVQSKEDVAGQVRGVCVRKLGCGMEEFGKREMSGFRRAGCQSASCYKSLQLRGFRRGGTHSQSATIGDLCSGFRSVE
ncbi:hypothetical protein M5K25_007070 [Dendrobium thyrsiflorum]|uniref:Uncharacterized protein n=1 Tax=Dendrobium thyrsiflorum TaxID=117978 RepID=A0ABD0VDA9_DENTH